MALSLTEIDRLIADWQSKLQRVSQNLLELQALPIFQTLSSPSLSLTGQTAQQVSRSIDAVNDLFSQFSLLSDILTQAQALRRKINVHFPSEPRLQEIARLFSQPTIVLPGTPQPLARRNLLGPAEVIETLTPDDLLVKMNQTFLWARDVVLAVDQAWSRLEQDLLAFQTQVNQLRTQAQALGVPTLVDLSRTEALLAQLRDRRLEDPLGSQADVQEQLPPLLQSAQQTLTMVANQMAQVSQQFAQAEQQLTQLRSQNQQIQCLYEECRLKVQHTLSPMLSPVSVEAIAALQAWLDRLTAKFESVKHESGNFRIGAIQPLLVGLDHWLAQAQGLLQQQARAIAANQAPLEQRREFRGRLEALQAKAQARGYGEDPQLSGWAEHARELLYRRPSPLPTVAGLLKSYEQRLNQTVQVN